MGHRTVSVAYNTLLVHLADQSLFNLEICVNWHPNRLWHIEYIIIQINPRRYFKINRDHFLLKIMRNDDCFLLNNWSSDLTKTRFSLFIGSSNVNTMETQLVESSLFESEKFERFNANQHGRVHFLSGVWLFFFTILSFCFGPFELGW